VRGYAEAVSRKGNIRRRGSKVRRLRLAGLAANFRANCGVFQRPKSHQEFASKAKRNREERHWRESPRFSEPPSAIIQNRERSRVCEEAALSLSLSFFPLADGDLHPRASSAYLDPRVSVNQIPEHAEFTTPALASFCAVAIRRLSLLLSLSAVRDSLLGVQPCFSTTKMSVATQRPTR